MNIYCKICTALLTNHSKGTGADALLHVSYRGKAVEMNLPTEIIEEYFAE